MIRYHEMDAVIVISIKNNPSTREIIFFYKKNPRDLDSELVPSTRYDKKSWTKKLFTGIS